MPFIGWQKQVTVILAEFRVALDLYCFSKLLIRSFHSLVVYANKNMSVTFHFFSVLEPDLLLLQMNVAL
jgi:hypothetical protein